MFRSYGSALLCVGRCVLQEEFFDAGFRRGESRTRLPLRDELAVREQLREFLGDRVGLRLIVAGRPETGRLNCQYEDTVILQ